MINVLVVDDHEIVRKGLVSLINEQQDMTVAGEAANGIIALSKASELHPDVIIMDVSMGEMNGIEAMRKILEMDPNAKVIILTMHHKRQLAMDSLMTGAVGFVLKDDICSDLVSAIHASVTGGVFISPAISKTILSKDAPDGDQKYRDTSFYILSPREREVLQMIAEGKSTKIIAFDLHISIKTVETLRQRMMKKLNLFSVADLTKFAVGEGLVPLKY